MDADLHGLLFQHNSRQVEIVHKLLIHVAHILPAGLGNDDKPLALQRLQRRADVISGCLIHIGDLRLRYGAGSVKMI